MVMVKKKEQIRISAKNLGQLALKNCCRKCFYIKLKLNNRMPFQIFPGIFSSIDSYSKSICWTYYIKHNRLPPWFSDFGECDKPVKVPGWNKFFVVDKETNIKLTGIPDEIVKKKDGSYAIIDYKTARFTTYQDVLHPMYEVQLNGYAMIAEQIGIRPISQLVLLYYEPVTDIIEIGREKLNELVNEDHFMMGFRAHSLEVELDPEAVVMPLLKEVRGMVDRGVVPQGNGDCQDCGKLGGVVKLIGRMDEK